MQTIAVPMLRTGHRLVALVLVAVALAVAVTVGIVHYASGTTSSHPASSPIAVERCLAHRPC
jgi:hypothetical protein